MMHLFVCGWSLVRGKKKKSQDLLHQLGFSSCCTRWGEAGGAFPCPGWSFCWGGSSGWAQTIATVSSVGQAALGESRESLRGWSVCAGSWVAGVPPHPPPLRCPLCIYTVATLSQYTVLSRELPGVQEQGVQGWKRWEWRRGSFPDLHTWCHFFVSAWLLFCARDHSHWWPFAVATEARTLLLVW